MERMVDRVCAYCREKMGEKLIEVPEDYPVDLTPETTGVCESCFVLATARIRGEGVACGG